MMMKKIFFSYSFNDSKVINAFYEIFKNAKNCDIYSYLHVRHLIDFDKAIENALHHCDYFCLFIGAKFGETQKKELSYYIQNSHSGAKSIFLIKLPGYSEKNDPFISDLNVASRKPSSIIILNSIDEDEIFKKALELGNVNNLDLDLDFNDDLPKNPHLFDYEKTIIDFYINKNNLNEKSINPKKIDEFLEKFIPKDDYDEIKDKDIDSKKHIAGECIYDKIKDGCPNYWPQVKKRTPDENALIKNSLLDIGAFRKPDANVIVAALTDYHIKEHCLHENNFSFPEAGPRDLLYFPKYARIESNRVFRVAILVSGGIAPGINAVIDGITQRHYKYFRELKDTGGNKELEVWGLKNGFRSFSDLNSQYKKLIDGVEKKSKKNKLGENEICTADYVNEGGSIIGTAREDALLKSDKTKSLKKIVQKLKDNKIRILYIIGGDGSMKAAHSISYIAENEKDEGWDLSVIGIPKTMDNDILWVWQTFGFLSAVEKGRELIDVLNTEVSSNPRLGIVQLFGSDSGFVVSHTVLASKTGVCDIALIPEEKFSIKKLLKEVQRIKEEKGYGLIVMSETAIPTDAIYYADSSLGSSYKKLLNGDEEKVIQEFVNKRNNGKHIEGQTNDHLRSAGLKIVSRSIKDKYGDEFRVLINEPRHILRAIPPSTSDIIFGSRLGTLAVDNAMAGYHDFMISQWLTEFVLVPLKLVVLGRKRIPNNGVFWKSVLAKTGQDSNMEE